MDSRERVSTTLAAAPRLDAVIRKVEAARAEGLAITADMYTYIVRDPGWEGM